MHEMFTLGVPAWELVCRAAIVYVALLILLRLSGKRTVVTGGLLVVVVLLLLDYISAFLASRFRKIEHILDGKPVLIARDGVVFHDVLKKCNVPAGTFDGVLRGHSLTTDQIGQAILEANGTITVCKRG